MLSSILAIVFVLIKNIFHLQSEMEMDYMLSDKSTSICRIINISTIGLCLFVVYDAIATQGNLVNYLRQNHQQTAAAKFYIL